MTHTISCEDWVCIRKLTPIGAILLGARGKKFNMNIYLFCIECLSEPFSCKNSGETQHRLMLQPYFYFTFKLGIDYVWNSIKKIKKLHARSKSFLLTLFRFVCTLIDLISKPKYKKQKCILERMYFIYKNVKHKTSFQY